MNRMFFRIKLWLTVFNASNFSANVEKNKKPLFENEKGLILILMSILISASAFLGVLVSQNFSLAKESLRTGDEVALMTAIEGLSATILTGIKSRWCFTRDLVPVDCNDGGKNVLNHWFSAERFLLKDSGWEAINEARKSQCERLRAGGVPLDSFVYPQNPSCNEILQDPNNPAKIPFDSIAIKDREMELSEEMIRGSDLLSDSLGGFLDSRGTRLRLKPPMVVRVARDENYPELGDEVYISVEITVTFELDKRSKKLEFKQVVAFYPRQLTSFGLILARDLYLGGEEVTSSAIGGCTLPGINEKFPYLSNPVEIGSIPFSQYNKYKGLKFLSPVFINGNLYVSDKKDKVVPVAFQSSVVLGGGRIVGHTPSLTNESQTKISSLKPGILNGVVQEASDKGLETFARQRVCVNLSSNQQACINEVEVDPRYGAKAVDAPLGGVISMATGFGVNCAHLEDGSLKCWGNGDPSSPNLMSNISFRNVRKIVLGERHACVLFNDDTTTAANEAGSVKCWGDNTSYQLGRGGGGVSAQYSVEPNGLGVVSEIVAGKYHTCAIKNSGSVECWGHGRYGELGDSRASSSEPVVVSGLTSVRQIALGWGHTCAVSNYGNVTCWGLNYSDQLGATTTETCDDATPCSKTPVAVSGLTNVRQIALGAEHTCALLSNKNVTCWGNNQYGQLGDGSTTNRRIPVVVSGLSNVEQIALGALHSCALLSNKSVQCWGNAGRRQLGNGGTTNRTRPVAVSSLSDVSKIYLREFHSCALLSDKTQKCWGSNGSQQLSAIDSPECSNDGTSFKCIPTPVNFYDGSTYDIYPNATFAAGKKHSCLVFEQEVLCGGDAQYEGRSSILGRGSSQNIGQSAKREYTAAGGLNNPISTARGVDTYGEHSCALIYESDDKPYEVKCWGRGDSGQLGNGGNSESEIPVFVDNTSGGRLSVYQIAIGGEHTCAIVPNTGQGSVMCWGKNDRGQLGDGTTTSRPLAVFVPIYNVTEIKAGGKHTCALTYTGRVWCWGSNQYGQLSARVLGTNDFYVRPINVQGLSGIKAIALGDEHTCALLSNKTVKCWGRNNKNQLGNGRSYGNFPTPFPVKKTGGGSLTGISISPGRTSLVAGSAHTCALTEVIGAALSSVYCWGANDRKQVGQASGVNFPTAKLLPTVSGTDLEIAGGLYHNCFRDGSKVKCWGDNTYKQFSASTTEPNANSSANPLGLSQCDESGEIGNDGAVTYESVGWGVDFSSQVFDIWDYVEETVTLEEARVLVEGRVNSVDDDGKVVCNNCNATAYFLNEAGRAYDLGSKSIASECVVSSSTNFVAGLFMCYRFIIAARNTPLSISGTVITNDLSIDESALKAGITWSNIWHPLAVYNLRKTKILKRVADLGNGEECGSRESSGFVLNDVPGSASVENYKSCSSSSLLNEGEKGVNFKWTEVDPDCGQPLANGAENKCKSHKKRYGMRRIFSVFK